jgi:hypothetical protein
MVTAEEDTDFVVLGPDDEFQRCSGVWEANLDVLLVRGEMRKWLEGP